MSDKAWETIGLMFVMLLLFLPMIIESIGDARRRK